jgi:hypothetical protein
LKREHPELILDEVINLPLGEAIIQDFLGHCSIKSHKDGSYCVPRQYNSTMLVGGYISAIKWHYQSRNIEISEPVSKVFKDFLAGYKREVATLKESGGMKFTEGKQPMSFNGDESLAQKALTIQGDYQLQITAHTYLIFCWNLMARAVTTGGLCFDRITWEEDSLVVSISKMKNDQEGQNLMPRHVYANREPYSLPCVKSGYPHLLKRSSE